MAGGGSGRGGGGHGGGGAAKDYPLQYFAASAAAALINYPLWRVSAIGQSGFHVPAGPMVPPALAPYLFAMSPPYKGAVATVFGMTWARAAIFYGSDAGRDLLRKRGWSDQVSIVVPPIAVSTVVQFVNQPVVRATVTIQDPACQLPNVWQAVKHIYGTRGLLGLWHGTSAGILKTVPKYCTAIIVKDVMEEWLQAPDPSLPPQQFKNAQLWNSAIKSATAGIAGAVLTNPLDVIRNEMFKTHKSLFATVRHLRRETKWAFLWRGMGKNVVAVSIPVACTIFFTDALIQYSQSLAL